MPQTMQQKRIKSLELLKQALANRTTQHQRLLADGFDDLPLKAKAANLTRTIEQTEAAIAANR